MEKITIENNDIFFYDSNDPVISYLKQGHLFGYGNYSLIQNYNKNKNGWIIDCGAHIGTFSFVPALNNKKVLAIEAASQNYECLIETFKNKQNIIIDNSVILDKEQKCNFNESYGPFGSPQINEAGSRKSNTIDNICKINNIEDVSIIKYDIEGYEEEALLGSVNTLAKSKPVLLIEINGHCLRVRDKKPYHVLKTLNELGYLYFLHNENGLIPIDKYKKFPFCVSDLVCIHKDNLFMYIGDINIHKYFPDSHIEQIIKQNRANSNQDCINYFNSL